MAQPKNPRSRLSRRGFLAGMGASAALAPFVPLLNASGAESATPKRLVLFFTPHGMVRDNWISKDGGGQWSLGPILEPLSHHQDKLVLVDGLTMLGEETLGAPHTKGLPLLWTASPLLDDDTFERDDGDGVYTYGWNSARSFDQLIAEELASDTPYRSLEFGVRTGSSHPGHRMIYSGAGAPLASQDDPYRSLTRLFGAGSTAAELEQLNAQRGSILDLVKSDLYRLENRVPKADRIKIESHLDAIRDIEKTVASGIACEPPEIPGGLSTTNMADIPQVFAAQLELMARAMACDLTRVMSMQFSVGENDHIVYDWLGVDYEIHHLITHENTVAANADVSLIYTWYAQQVAYFLDLLAEIPEGDGTVLDNTLVLWGSEISRGWDHSFENMPFVLAGGCGGAIQTNQILRAPGVEHNRLLVSACHAMGVTNVEEFGLTDIGSGVLPGLLL